MHRLKPVHTGTGTIPHALRSKPCADMHPSPQSALLGASTFYLSLPTSTPAPTPPPSSSSFLNPKFSPSPSPGLPRLQLPGDPVHLKGRKKEKGRKNRKKEGNRRMKPDRRGSGALSYLSASQWIWTLLSSVLPVSVSRGNTAPIWQACSRLGWAPGPHWRPGAWLAVEPPPHHGLYLFQNSSRLAKAWRAYITAWLSLTFPFLQRYWSLKTSCTYNSVSVSVSKKP